MALSKKQQTNRIQPNQQLWPRCPAPLRRLASLRYSEEPFNQCSLRAYLLWYFLVAGAGAYVILRLLLLMLQLLQQQQQQQQQQELQQLQQLQQQLQIAGNISARKNSS